VQHGQYHPAFYLPKYDVYIEHWACDESGSLPVNWSHSDQEEYKSGMIWKRDLHQRRAINAPPLIETYSSIKGAFAIIPRLKEQLNALGIYPEPISEQQRNQIVSSEEVIDPVVKLVSSFIALFWESGASAEMIHARCMASGDLRGLAFIEMFVWVHSRYQKYLEGEGAIDFSDMIREASAALRSGAVLLELDYVLVDEFQGISRGRADFIAAVLEQNPDCWLIAVGDDWQSINRFAGSDIQMMVDFAEIFGATQETHLRKTHRFGSELLKATSLFI